MFIKEFSKYLVLKMEDVDRISPMDRQYLDRAVMATTVQRLKAKKPDRNYVVVSDKNPELYDKVWALIAEDAANEQKDKSTT